MRALRRRDKQRDDAEQIDAENGRAQHRAVADVAVDKGEAARDEQQRPEIDGRLRGVARRVRDDDCRGKRRENFIAVLLRRVGACRFVMRDDINQKKRAT